jgi:hypothetical protein
MSRLVVAKARYFSQSVSIAPPFRDIVGPRGEAKRRPSN